MAGDRRRSLSSVPGLLSSHLNQAGIIADGGNLLSQIGEGRKAMPTPQEMIGGRSQQAAGFTAGAQSTGGFRDVST